MIQAAPRHLYVHVPFCARRCTYCDFAIAVRRTVPAAAYLAALQAERDLASAGAWDPGRLETLYLGGGTPSLLPPDSTAALLASLSGGRALAEVTLEANPDDVTPGAVRAWRAAGVNRLSIGAQSFEPAVLAWMHRTHTAAAIGAAVAAARAEGVANISLDLIVALPASLGRDLRADLAQLMALEPDHVSLYGLTVEPGTALARQLGRGEAAPAPDGRYEEEYLLAHELLAAAGYHSYEVSNAARPGREAVHNAAYWRLAPYLGLGPGAHSFDGHQRWWNDGAYAAWQRRLAAGERPVAGHEFLDAPQRDLERLYLGLRTAAGVPLEPGSRLAARAEAWVREGWARVHEDVGPRDGGTDDSSPVQSGVRSPGRTVPRLVLTPKGWLRLDSLIASI